ncbi:Cysteine-rich PDZ-binding protein [Plasmodiophora brassicae]|uniref:Cysteine-rich PDZ-binding protein n=1 Tax=Plasmodiophora brassicae TaxID=37360 RepID=A0A0G4INX9_PLABS|nr:hypothetical protein PBRA_005560 [Plasmodiophora brassicae]SPR01908.1 unnamed protein product [Plasmodiophora brassicae]
MVCTKCEAKLSTVCVPDQWKDGARNVRKTIAKASTTAAAKSSGSAKTGQLVSQNMLLKKREVKSVGSERRVCRICRCQVHQYGHYYCQQCAYVKGICSMCGVKILNTKMYKQSST